MRRPFRLRHLFVLLFCLMLCLRPVQPAAASRAVASPAQANTYSPPQAVAPFASSTFQLAIDRLVRQALAAGGWSVAALQSQLVLADPTGAAPHQSGSGRWHADVLDEKQQPLTLEGVLTVEMQIYAQADVPAASSLSIKGTLTAAKPALEIDA